LGTHARDELGFSPNTRARPLQAAAASAGSFSIGAALPLVVAAAVPERYLMFSIAAASLACLLLLGGWSANVGGADMRLGALRVAFWSALAMAVTTAVGAAVGTL
jgi:vacuolar iron transporter family protein